MRAVALCCVAEVFCQTSCHVGPPGLCNLESAPPFHPGNLESALSLEGLCLSGTVCSKNSNWANLGVSVGVAFTLSVISCHAIHCLVPMGFAWLLQAFGIAAFMWRRP